MASKDPAALIGDIFGSAIGKVVSSLTDALAPVTKVVDQAQQGQSQASTGLAQFAAGLGGAATAATAALGAVQGILSQLGQFVGALSPGTMEQFNRSIKDLQATFGVAFKPIFQILTDTFKEVGGIVLPIMESLRPVVEQVAQTMVANLIPNVKLLADIFTALIPLIQIAAVVFELMEAILRPVIAVFQIIAVSIGAQLQLLLLVLSPLLEILKLVSAAFDGLSQVINVIAIIFRVLVDMLGAFLKSIAAFFSVKGLMDGMNQAIRNVITALVQFVGTIMKFFGLSLQPLIDGLSKKSGAAAAEPPSFKGFEQVGKDLALAAAGAGGEGKKSSEDFLKDAVEELKKIQSGASEGNETVLKVLNEIKSGIDKLVAAKNFVETGATYLKGASQVAGAVTNPLGTLAVAAYNRVRGG